MGIKTLDEILDEVDYSLIGSQNHTEFAYKFMSFIKMCNYPDGESNKTPPVHLKMLDNLIDGNKYVVNLCFRGLGKTSVFAEYLFLYIAVFGKLDKFGDLDGAMYVSDSMENGVKSLRKNIESRYYKSDFLQQMLPEAKFTDTCLEFTNKDGHEFMVKMYGATTGIRGVKMKGKRPCLAIIDDILSDEMARSPTVLKSIKETLYSGLLPALDPNRQKVIFNGTPFNKQDPLIEAVESGKWTVNAYPVCEKFPCTKEEFKGAWEDRFTYESVLDRYELMKGTGHEDSFYQEMMLRINSSDSRLISDEEILRYDRNEILPVINDFNIYITTDFATSSKNSADFSVISVWAYSSDGSWYWIDGRAIKTTMDRNIDDLFMYVSMYKPLSVGIEITGQQGGFISWIHSEMMKRKCWFTLAGSHGSEGIRPTTDKLSRFNLILPMFRMHKIFFPYGESETLKEFVQELKLITRDGIKGHDDCIDTISMLSFMNAWVPNTSMHNLEKRVDKKRTFSKYFGSWEEESSNTNENYKSYFV